MMNAHIRRFMDLSTGHLPKSDRELLEAYAQSGGATGLSCLSGPHGWFVWVGERRCSPDWPGSVSLRRILEDAANNGCDYVMFDSDGMVEEAYQFFDDEDE
ncbi:DUF5983 family protein [Acetobacter oeni]|uniref:DUF5983 domain-containing protein n=1 Tax=Acetobacter oeni TaxID=304077 RepID=A0A511XNI3_9PROT|nr:hypothetical protein [Acetobacter oeni]MBB3884384.1 hypothetical protein [Acetobacter oeni]NHO20337.1 hypothetical protein [Acetobacter oeni]GBR09697.1 hypothetical protein AA21952_2913 [Acetobacter oeni LMG 21952]GEN64520.1 hypothetical protein AOE01nite_27440 [Acetobacter oeni]